MRCALSDRNLDASRSVGLLIAVAGLAVVSVGIAVSPVGAFDQLQGWSFGMVLLAAIAPVFGAAAVGYALNRDLGRKLAVCPTLAYGSAAALLLVVTFAVAAVIRPAVRGVAGLGDVETGIVAGGLLIAFVGAFQSNHAAGGWRFVALGLLGGLLFAGWILSAAGGAWEAAWQDAPLSSGGIACLALAVSRRPSDLSALMSGT